MVKPVILITCALIAGTAIPSTAALAANPTGRWGDKDQPKGASDYIVQADPLHKIVRIQLPNSIKLPSGQVLTLKEVAPNAWRSSPGANPIVVFDMNGPNSAHFSLKGAQLGKSWFSGWAIDLDDRLVRR